MQNPNRETKVISKSINDELIFDVMTLGDLDEVMKIERRSFSAPWSRSYFVHEITGNPVCFPFTLKKRGGERQLLAYCICWILDEELHINNIAVHPDFRRRGYAGILLQNIMEFGVASHCRRAALEVRISNAGAIALYEKLGFQKTGLLSRYYQDNREDAFVLKKYF